MTAVYELVQFRTQPGLGVHVAAIGWLRKFLVSPARNPDAPRLWCVRVDVCNSTGDPDPDHPSMISQCTLSHSEMVDVFRAIRSDPSEWMASKEQSAVRAWMQANDKPAATVAKDDLPTAPAPDHEEQHAQT